jgi:hypothetical protein
MAITALFFGVLVATAPASDSQQFDLVCNGTSRSNFNGRLSTSPVTMRISVDLSERRYKIHGVGGVENLNRLTSDEIEFERQNSQFGGSYFVVNRNNGQFTSRSSVIGPRLTSSVEMTGECVAGEFTALPARRF